MIQNSLVYFTADEVHRPVLGCGVFVGDLIVTCAHVVNNNLELGRSTLIAEYPYATGDCKESRVRLIDVGPKAAAADLAFFWPEVRPAQMTSLDLAIDEHAEAGEATAIGRVFRHDEWCTAEPKGSLSALKSSSTGLRQFSGIVPHHYWLAEGMSGAPVVRKCGHLYGQVLLGLVKRAELGKNEGDTHLLEGSVIPASIIRPLLIAAKERAFLTIALLEPAIVRDAMPNPQALTFEAAVFD